MSFLKDLIFPGLNTRSNVSETGKELAKQNRIMRENQKAREDAERRRRIERSDELYAYRYYRRQVIKENQERKRKGQPELPVPPWMG